MNLLFRFDFLIYWKRIWINFRIYFTSAAPVFRFKIIFSGTEKTGFTHTCAKSIRLEKLLCRVRSLFITIFMLVNISTIQDILLFFIIIIIPTIFICFFLNFSYHLIGLLIFLNRRDPIINLHLIKSRAVNLSGRLRLLRFFFFSFLIVNVDF